MTVKITSVVGLVDTGFQFRGRVEPDANGNVAVLQVKDLKDRDRARAHVGADDIADRMDARVRAAGHGHVLRDGEERPERVADDTLAFRRAFGIVVRQLYGSTETGTISFNDHPQPEPHLASVGRAL